MPPKKAFCQHGRRFWKTKLLANAMNKLSSKLDVLQRQSGMFIYNGVHDLRGSVFSRKRGPAYKVCSLNSDTQHSEMLWEMHTQRRPFGLAHKQARLPGPHFKFQFYSSSKFLASAVPCKTWPPLVSSVSQKTFLSGNETRNPSEWPSTDHSRTF